MQPSPARPPATRWLAQLGSALTAVVLIAAVLTPIALSTGPAQAHSQTVERCSFDPFAGQQCWDENVAHTHTPPPPSTTPPGQGHPGGTDNEEQDRPDPPDTTPPGQGHPGGTDNEEQDRPDPPDTTPPGQGHPGGTDNEEQDRPDPPDTTPPGQGHPGGTDNEEQDRPDPPDTTPPGQGHPGGTDNEEQDRPDPPDTTPPSESQSDPDPEPVVCTGGQHRYGTGCHSHSFTPPCGTGTWVPHAGHTRVQKPPCPTTPPTTTTTAETHTGTPCGGSGGQGASAHHEHDGLDCHAEPVTHSTQQNPDCPTRSGVVVVTCSGDFGTWTLYDAAMGCYVPPDANDDGVRGKLHRHDDHDCHPTGEAWHCKPPNHYHGPDGEETCHSDDPNYHCPINKHTHEWGGETVGCHPDDPSYHDPTVLDEISALLGPVVDDVGEFVIIQASQYYVCRLFGKYVKFVGASSLCQGTLYAVTEVSSTSDEINPPATEPETSTTEGPSAPTVTQPPAENYCTPWESFAQYGLPYLGKVNLYENGVSVTQYQGSREWATARCEAALANLGQ